MYEKECYSWDIWGFYFSFLENFLTDFHNDCPSLHSYQGEHIFSFPIPSPVSVVILFLNDSHLECGDKEFFSSFVMYFIEINWWIIDINHMFKCLFIINISSYENYLFIYIAYFVGLFVLFYFLMVHVF